MSTKVCKEHRKRYCEDCRMKSRTNYTEDYSSNLFTTVASSWPSSYNDDGVSHHGSSHHDSGGSSHSSHDGGGGGCGSGGGD